MQIQQSAGNTSMGVYLPELNRLALLTYRGDQKDKLDWPKNKSTTWRQLDVSILQIAILERVLNLGDHELAQGNFVEYVSDAQEALLKGSKNSCQCVIFLNPTPMAQVEAVVEAGDLLKKQLTSIPSSWKVWYLPNTCNPNCVTSRPCICVFFSFKENLCKFLKVSPCPFPTTPTKFARKRLRLLLK